jgi:hypothetical protein
MKSMTITVKYNGLQSKQGEASFFIDSETESTSPVFTIIFSHVEVVGNNFLLYCSDNGATEKGRLCGIYGLNEFAVMFCDAQLKYQPKRG